MRMIVRIGYECYLVPNTVDISALIGALVGLRLVEEINGGYNEPRSFVPKKVTRDREISPIFIDENQIIDETKAAEIDATKASKDRERLVTENLKLKSDMAILQKQVAEIQKAISPSDAKQAEG